MHSHELGIGRTVMAVFDHGEDFFTALDAACRAHTIQQGYIPMFIAGLRTADLVGTCEQLDDPNAPVWSKVQLTNVEAIGGGTLAYDPESDTITPHVHLSVGLKAHSATAHTSHLLAATVQFLTEMVIVEVTEPTLRRVRQPDLYDVPLLRFRPEPGE
jgi:predicted DNA-binding protein with PD1-like motif